MARGIDHLVIAVRDLDEAGRLYERMGFQVGARNRHPWGTENRIIQLGRSFLELVTVGESAEIPEHGPARFSFGAFIRRYLERREGLAMLALDSSDAAADSQLFAEAGIGAFTPFSFERRGRRADGSETHVAFTLAFARDEGSPEAGFFTCQHHRPENFWSPAMQRHRNGAIGVGSVMLASDRPEGHDSFLSAFTGATPEAPETRDRSFRLQGARLDVVTRDDAAIMLGSVEAEASEPGFVAFAIDVGDLKNVLACLEAGGVPCQAIGSRAVVPASAARGVAIAFEQA